MYAVTGKQKQAREILTRLEKRKASGRYVSPTTLAGLHADLGEKDEAFRLLDEAANDRDIWLADIRMDPSLASLRGDPRYARFLQRMHMPP